MANEDVVSRYERLLTEKDQTIRVLSASGKPMPGDGAVLRAALRTAFAKIDELSKRIDANERAHEIEMAELRAEHAREMNRIGGGDPPGPTPKRKGGKGGGAGGPSRPPPRQDDHDGGALLNSAATPSSKNPVQYHSVKKYLGEKARECEEKNGEFQPDPDDPGRCIYCHRRHGPHVRIGAPFGHAGHRTGRTAERVTVVCVEQCRCGRKKLASLAPECKLCIDYDGDRRGVAVVLFKREVKYCRRCALVIVAPDPCVPGTSMGRGLASHIVEMAGEGDTPSRMVKNVRTITGETFSQNAMKNCVLAVAENGLATSMRHIMEAIRESPWVQIDETPMPMNGRRGYVWLVRTDRATFVVATPSRSAEVIPTFFGALIGKKATVDGYAAYPRFFGVHRCWSHELCIAQNLAVRGGVGSLHDMLFDELRRTYYMAAVLAARGGATEGQIRLLKDELRETISKYGDHPFAGRLTRALDALFTALRVPGMPLTNNAAEADIRKVVIYRNLHHQFRTPRGRAAFSVLHSFVRTAEKNGLVPSRAILCRLNDPSWSLFGGCGGAPHAGKPTYRPPTDAERAVLGFVPPGPDITESPQPEPPQPEPPTESPQPESPSNPAMPEKRDGDMRSVQRSDVYTAPVSAPCVFAAALLLLYCFMCILGIMRPAVAIATASRQTIPVSGHAGAPPLEPRPLLLLPAHAQTVWHRPSAAANIQRV